MCGFSSIIFQKIFFLRSIVIGTAGLLWESVAWASVTLLSLQFHDPGIQYERLQMSHMLTGSSLIYAGVAMSD